jgi:hypothetical protein
MPTGRPDAGRTAKINDNNRLAHVRQDNSAPISAMDAVACTGDVRHSRFAVY